MTEPARRHEPGLDGLRAVAVVAVLCFHSGFSWAVGGYLGVSVFFALSGFLITGLLMGEIERTGRVDLRSFWVRRFRRLLPASALALLFVAVCVPWFDAAHRAAQVRGDVLAALLHVANWRFVAAHQSYADLFVAGPSPVLHFWSLAVEEQFYVLVPMVLAAAAWLASRRGRSAVRAVPVAIVVLLAGSLVAALLTRSTDVGYYGTHIRAAEFLVGGAAALVVRQVRRRTSWSRAASALPALAGVVSLVVFVWAAHSVEQSASWLYRGGFAALAVVWCGLLAGALGPGPMRAVLGSWPFRTVGTLSYGIYLFHWPVFLVLTPERTGLGAPALFVVRVALAVALATGSYHLLEQPVRTRRWRLAGGRGVAALAVSMALVGGITVVRAEQAPAALSNQQLDAPDEITHLGGGAGAGGDVRASSVITAPPEPVDVVVLGAPPSSPTLERAVANGMFSGRLIDLTEPGCAVFTPAAGCSSVVGALRSYLDAGGAPAAVVLSIGAQEHADAAEAEATATTESTESLVKFLGGLEARVGSTVASMRDISTPSTLIVLDDHPGHDTVAKLVEVAAVEAHDVFTLESRSVGQVVAAAVARAHAGATGQRMRLLVLGDSSSYGVALEVDRQAGDRFDVVWAGFRNCPMVELARLRWWRGVEFDMTVCAAAVRKWPQVIADTRPDVLVLAESLPELSDQDYGDGTWHALGDEAFAAAHEQAIVALMDQLEPFGTTVLVADAAAGPAVLPSRVAAWNALVAGWAQRWPQLQVVPWGAWVAGAEQDAGASLRPDAIHLDDVTEAHAVAEVYLPVLADLHAHRQAAPRGSSS